MESLRPYSSIWMLGDNPVADIEGARAAGMNALLDEDLARWKDILGEGKIKLQ